jgi:GNAT superfamily N-acetyltransferase
MTAHASAATIRVRSANVADITPIADLCGQLGYPSTPQEVEERLRSVQGNPEHAVFVAELPGGTVAGWIHIFIMRTIEADPRAEVGGLVVDERSRSKGVGHRLLEQAERWTREHGCRVVGLRSNVIRERAHAFYERQGYQVIKSQKSFRKTLE